MKQPTFRCPTQIAIQTLAKEFSYPNDSYMQDWEYEVAVLSDIEKYFTKYAATNVPDIRFTLAKMMLETSNENSEFDWLSAVWPRLRQLLLANFELHEYTIFYWCSFESENIDDTFYISPYMRQLWNEVINSRE
jgi:hypothetical protein